MNNVAQLNGWTQLACAQVVHSFLYLTEVSLQVFRSIANRLKNLQKLELFSYCNYKGIGITSHSPLMDEYLARATETQRTRRAKGSIFERKHNDSDLKIIQRVQELTQKHSWTTPQVSLAWSATKISSPVVGANTVIAEL